MKIGIDFLRINMDWDIDHDLPDLTYAVFGQDLLITIRLDHWMHRRFAMNDRAIIRFNNASLFRLGAPGALEWRQGKCRYGQQSIEWGHFFEIIGMDDKRFWPKDWQRTKAKTAFNRHFILQTEDATFECIADRWLIEPSEKNALFTRAETDNHYEVKDVVDPEVANAGWQGKVGSFFRRALQRT
jgi:hypothetical protein